MKSAGVTLAAAAAACIVSAGAAQADVPAFTTPFVEPGCLCAGLLPAPVVTRHVGELNEIIGNSGGDTCAGVAYTNLPPGQTLANIAVNVEQGTGMPVQFGSYRGRPSVTTGLVVKGDRTFVYTYFIDGGHVIMLTGIGADPEDAQASLVALAANFQIL